MPSIVIINHMPFHRATANRTAVMDTSNKWISTIVGWPHNDGKVNEFIGPIYSRYLNITYSLIRSLQSYIKWRKKMLIWCRVREVNINDFASFVYSFLWQSARNSMLHIASEPERVHWLTDWQHSIVVVSSSSSTATSSGGLTTYATKNMEFLIVSTHPLAPNRLLKCSKILFFEFAWGCHLLTIRTKMCKHCIIGSKCKWPSAAFAYVLSITCEDNNQ